MRSHGLDDEDPQQMRDRIFSAVRALAEAVSGRRPFVLVVEDIHWADEGMLDLIEYLARWVRGPLLLICLARDELLDRRPGWGGGRRNATSLSLEPLSSEQARTLVDALIPEGDGGGNGLAETDPPGRRPLRRQPAFRRGDGQPPDGGGHRQRRDRQPCRRPCIRCSRRGSTRSRSVERRLVQHASVVGQTFWEGSLARGRRGGGPVLEAALESLQEKDLDRSARPGSRIAGEHEYSFKHVLIRDVAYSTLPKAVRARKHFEVGGFIAEHAGERGEGWSRRRGALRSSRIARRRVRPRRRPSGSGSTRWRSPRSRPPATPPPASTRTSRRSATTRPRSSCPADSPRTRGRGSARSRATSRCGSAGSTPRSRSGSGALDYHRREEDLARIGDLHRKIGAGLWHKGEREASIGHYQKGIDLLKDGPPCIELVRLYEEAASLYLHTGDNMLAIYAAEKALRLAERLGESAAASRAHLIFGRVFGRIGNPEKARENLERSVELARDSDPGEAIRALLALGNHLEVSEAEYAAAAEAYGEALALSEQVGDLPSQVELHAALAQLAAYGATGTRSRAPRRPPQSSPTARACSASSASRS